MSRRFRPGKRTLWISGIAVLLVGAAAAGLALSLAPTVPPPAKVDHRPTATVTRGDISTGSDYPATIDFGAAHPITGPGTGIITMLPAAGTVINQGDQLYRVNDEPVTLLIGTTPLYRELSLTGTPAGGGTANTGNSGNTDDPSSPPAAPPQAPPTPPRPPHGKDVAVVADNLAALGYTVGPQRGGEDRVFTPALSAAIRRWQKKQGLEQTGIVSPERFLVNPGPLRINAISARVGDPATGPVLTVTDTTRVITVPVPAGSAGGITVGAQAPVTLPGGSTLTGTIAALQNPPAGDSGGGTPSITVTLTTEPADAEKLTAAGTGGARVRFIGQTHPGVLIVPVTALITVQGGAQAIETPAGKLIAVTTGLFADGNVEISGDGVTEGLRVVVAS
ncbi:peptidoglycan hydrolase-like protein with peptidoglycan-binding domain [Mycetocola sp. BIGb0189]|uniref:peptidoglycan-binding protein n=1 Tax=Mycetocola sp. BIGb0189 TaxID=2940604 RepID=UPI002169AD70|nr:peptidoglycan-binding protein [Mycetocola sp. BIGb0189]MCS4275328.1 peptidoglycan hydrolase-like protein with peptidoglycan-binding domain [Mycetocola sp. BIGb0189]